jgi:syntaxin 7
MQMSWGDLGDGRNGASTPGWATGAKESLMPTLDLPAVKKSVTADIKELQKAAETLEKLASQAKKTPGGSVGEQLLTISTASRERARTTSRNLRTALGIALDGSAEHKELTKLSDQFKQALMKFQKQVEETSHLIPTPQLSAAGPSGDMEYGSPSGSGGGSSWGDPDGSGSSKPAAQQHSQQQLQQQEYDSQMAANEAIIAEREQGIGHLARSVQEVADIYQDLALLVQEQGSQIDNIQTNIESAATQTERGIAELVKANTHQKKNRSRMCLIALCIMALMVVLVLFLKYGIHAIR